MSLPAVTGAGPGSAPDDDARMLHDQGYPQELLRRVSAFGSFSVLFSNISVLSGPVTLMTFAMAYGGLTTLVWSWLLLGPLVLCVVRSLAEICAVHPTSGAVYHWSYQLARRHKIFASWVTAGLNTAGSLAGAASAAYSTSLFACAFAAMTWGVRDTPRLVLAVYAAVLLVCAGANSVAVRIAAWLNEASVWVHVGGVVAITAALALVPAHHASAHAVLLGFVNASGQPFPLGYAVALGSTTVLYTFTGLEGSCYLAEETVHAARTTPRAMVRAVGWSWVLGLVLVLGFAFGVQDYAAEAANPYGVSAAAILVDALGAGLGRALLLVVILAQLLCVLSCFTAGGRMAFAVGRDGVIPGSTALHTVNRARVPLRAVWFAAAATFALGACAYFSITVFYAIASLAATGLFTSYAIPVWLRLRAREFTPGGYRLRHPRATGWAALVFTAAAAVCACLPTVWPPTWAGFNYAPVVLVLALAVSCGWFLLAGRHAYRGPRRFTVEEMARIEADAL